MKILNAALESVSLFLIIACAAHGALAQSNQNTFVYGDALPDAPELAKAGDYPIGVQTIELVNPDQIDILNSKDGVDPMYDRPLTVEIWYPAITESAHDTLITYHEVMGNFGNPDRPVIPFTFKGRAARSAKPITTAGAFPLVILSHGYTGSRFLMTYLTENLASKGYVVAAIDHTESTYRDAAHFKSTLLNRPKDILFVLDEIAQLGRSDSEHFLSGIVDAESTAIMGYSMGGYGVLNAAGAGYSELSLNLFKVMSGGSEAISSLIGTNEAYKQSIDPRIKAMVAFAPWGMERGVWDAETLKGLKIPSFFISGSEDDISGYEKGVKAIYEGSIHSDRYLLTYANARHNIAPNPPPPDALAPGLHIDEYYRYADPAWSQKRMNNINQHFVTAFLGVHLKQKDYGKYLDIKEDSNEENWTGFVPRSSTGLQLLHESAQE